MLIARRLVHLFHFASNDLLCAWSQPNGPS